MQIPNKTPMYTMGFESLEEAAKDAKQISTPELMQAV
jgi:hypothetical protein